MWRIALPALIASSCGIIGPSCNGETGPVFSLSGEVAPGSMVVHLVQYGTDGSQNDGQFAWTGQWTPDGPRPQLFVTRIECEKFEPMNYQNVPECRLLDRAGWTDGYRDTSYMVTHGRGNPEMLGPNPQYKIWIVGDPQQSVQYTVSARWNRPVEC